MIKLKLNDAELKAGAEELYKSVLKALGDKDEDSDNQMEGDDESYETVSEEDISDDEEMKDWEDSETVCIYFLIRLITLKHSQFPRVDLLAYWLVLIVKNYRFHWCRLVLHG